MKKLKNLFPLFCLLILSISSCYYDIDDNDGGPFSCISGNDQFVSEVFNMDNFTGVRLKIDATVHISQGSTFEVIVEGEENIVDEIEKDVNGSVWEIEFNDCVKNHDPITIFITMPTLNFLRVSGSGEIVSQDILQVDDIEVVVSGSGSIDIGILADDVEGKISGSGEVFLEGEANDLDMKISGSGDLKAFDCPFINVDLTVSGSGDARVTVSDYLKVKISGSGDVYYKGFPTIDSDINGSGDLINAN